MLVSRTEDRNLKELQLALQTQWFVGTPKDPAVFGRQSSHWICIGGLQDVSCFLCYVLLRSGV